MEQNSEQVDGKQEDETVTIKNSTPIIRQAIKTRQWRRIRQCFYPYEGIECITEVFFTKTVKGFFSKCICIPKKRPLQLSIVISREKNNVKSSCHGSETSRRQQPENVT